MVNKVYILLGSNLGDKEKNLGRAREQLTTSIGNITQYSAIYETLPWGVSSQPNYWNQVLAIQTALEPYALLNVINQIEKELGRERLIRWESRIIDIDILYFNDSIIETDVLTIPHPELTNRRFTLVPLAEIAPDFIHPVLKVSNQYLLDYCTDKLAVLFVKKGKLPEPGITGLND